MKAAEMRLDKIVLGVVLVLQSPAMAITGAGGKVYNCPEASGLHLESPRTSSLPLLLPGEPTRQGESPSLQLL